MSSSILAYSQQNPNVPVSQLFTRTELFGKGAYGGVYKGVHNPTGTVVALKVIDLDTPDDDISEIQKEVALLSEMRDAARHNITLYHGCYLLGHELVIAMDFASGGSIRTILKTGIIQEQYSVLIIREVLVALSFLHKQGIIHRDIKAANVLLTQEGKIMLCDFGVAAHLQTNNKRSTFIGTPLWMAPEVITDGKLYDTKADIWSLGVTLYEIATGNPPHIGIEPLRACALIPRTAPAKLEGEQYSKEMKEFLGLCLQIDPQERPTADELTKTKWIKDVAKKPLTVLKELPQRYWAWQQAGGVRASIAGYENLTQDDDDEEVEGWEFNEDGDLSVEPLGDEPKPKTLDERAAESQIRPPKVHTAKPSRNPFQRLFEEEPAQENPYANPSPTGMTITLPSSFDTLKPTISIPSFDDLDEMSEPSTVRFGGSDRFDTSASSTLSVATGLEVTTPSTLRPNPFSWTQPSSQASLSAFGQDTSSSRPFGNASGNGPPSPYLPPSPRLDHDDVWGFGGSRAGTPTNASFPSEVQQHQGGAPVAHSPSLPSMTGDNRPFTMGRPRADTAPSSGYPPLGPGLPPVPTPTHSNKSSISSSATQSSSGIGGSGFFTPGGLSGGSTSSMSTFTSPVSFTSGPLSASPPQANRPFLGRARTAQATLPEADINRPFGNRSRQGSDAPTRPGVPLRMASAMAGAAMGEGNRPRGDSLGQGGQGQAFAFGGNRPRTPSDARPGGLQPKFGLKLQISTGAGGGGGPRPQGFASASHARTPSAIAREHASLPQSAPLHYDPRAAGRDFGVSPLSASMSKSSSAQGTNNGPPTGGLTPGFFGGLDGATPLASAVNGRAAEGGGFPFPDVATTSQPPVSSGLQAQGQQVAPPLVSLDALEASAREDGTGEGYSPKGWPTGPTLRPLDYGKLTTAASVQDELERTIEELGLWLGVVDEGLGRILGVSA